MGEAPQRIAAASRREGVALDETKRPVLSGREPHPLVALRKTVSGHVFSAFALGLDIR
jgi:hypothetical protein